MNGGVPGSRSRVVEVGDGGQAAWDRFILNHQGSTYAHRYCYRSVLESVYRMPTLFLALVAEDGTYRAALPLARARKIPGRIPVWVSMAHSSYGGILAAEEQDVGEARRAFLVRLRGIEPGEFTLEERTVRSDGVEPDSGEATFFSELPGSGDPTELWNAIRGKKRNQVRKGRAQGFWISWDVHRLDAFFDLYVEGMGRLGTPAHPRSFVEGLEKWFASDFRVLAVGHGDRVLAAMVSVIHRDTWTVLLASSDYESRSTCVNDLMYWTAMERACQEGLRIFDFGRSRLGGGPEHFKRQWNARAVGLPYVRVDETGAELSALTEAYRGKWGHRFGSVWQRLPRTVQLIVGPRLRSLIP